MPKRSNTLSYLGREDSLFSRSENAIAKEPERAILSAGVRRVTTRLIPVIHGRDRVREGYQALYALGCRTHLDGKPEGESSMSEKAGCGETVKP